MAPPLFPSPVTWVFADSNGEAGGQGVTSFAERLEAKLGGTVLNMSCIGAMAQSFEITTGAANCTGQGGAYERRVNSLFDANLFPDRILLYVGTNDANAGSKTTEQFAASVEAIASSYAVPLYVACNHQIDAAAGVRALITGYCDDYITDTGASGMITNCSHCCVGPDMKSKYDCAGADCIDNFHLSNSENEYLADRFQDAVDAGCSSTPPDNP